MAEPIPRDRLGRSKRLTAFHYGGDESNFNARTDVEEKSENGINLGSIGTFVSNVGLSVLICVVLLWQLVPPAAEMLRANAAAIPVHAQAAKEAAEAQQLAAKALEQNAAALNRVATAVENQTIVTKELMQVVRAERLGRTDFSFKPPELAP